jgi:hypothetical protein
VQRPLRTFRVEGAPVLRHKARGRPSNNRLRDGVRDLALALVRESYADFGPTLAAEKLAERQDLKVSRQTLREWMAEDDPWLSRRQRRTFHQPRLRRERLGELVQTCGSEHRWLKVGRPPARCWCSSTMPPAGSCETAVRGLGEHLRVLRSAGGLVSHEHGRLVAFHSDKHSIFRVAKSDAASGHGMTQVSALAELNVEILCANPSQAKGRIERANRTLQARLVEEMRLEGISDMTAANAFLPGFMARHNLRFAKAPAPPDDLHRPLADAADRFRDVLCWPRPGRRGPAAHVQLRAQAHHAEDRGHARPRGPIRGHFRVPDGRLEVRWKGVPLTYRAFDPDQRT